MTGSDSFVLATTVATIGEILGGRERPKEDNKAKRKTPENVVFSRVCGGRNRTRTCDPIDVNYNGTRKLDQPL